MRDERFTGWASLPAANRACSCFGKSEFVLRLDNKSRMSREVHVRFREGLGCDSPGLLDLAYSCGQNAREIA